jgi:uncharacterized protein
LKTIALLTLSNCFMTYAWYGHLRNKHSPLLWAILSSWLIAFFEYCFQVPANRMGYGEFTVTQLKVLQEIITLSVFSIFAIGVLHEQWMWKYLWSFLCILGAVFFAFQR